MNRRSAVRACRAFLFCVAALLSPGLLYADSITIHILSPVNGDQQAANGNWDSGTFTLTVNGYSETVNFNKFSTPASVASGLAAKFSQDCSTQLLAHANTGTVTIWPKTPAVSAPVVTASVTWDTADFAHSSFSLQQQTLPTPSLALTCSPNPIPSGGAVDCTAELPKNAGGGSGTVSFSMDGQQSWSTVTVDSDGFAPASTYSSLSSGQHTVAASYTGNSSYNPTTQTVSLQVNSTTSLPSTTAYSYTIAPAPGSPNTSGYAGNGNLLSYMDSVNGAWSNNVYDSMNRLISATDTSVGSSTPQYWCWSYDSFGNRKSEANGTSSFGGTCPTNGTGASGHQYNAQNQISGDIAIAYDGAGDTTSDHSNAYLYDGDGRVCAVNNGLIMTQYIYDAEGNRVAKGTISTWSCDSSANGFQATSSYVLGLGGEQVTEMNVNSGQSTWAHTNVNAGGVPVATYDPLGLHFHLEDWLGNRRVQTNAFGQTEETCANAPFGNGLICTSPEWAPVTADDATEPHFTGKERDTESGLDYFEARYYGSSMGRFISPDPSGLLAQSPADPQSWNLYAYARNNPLVNIDPTGLDCVYYNDPGDKVESVDHNSSSDECGQNGGNWEEGYTEAGWQNYNQKSGTWTGFSADSNNVYMYGGAAPGGNGTGDGSNYMPACQGNCMYGTSASINFLNSQLQNGATLLGLMQFAITQTNGLNNASHDLINFTTGPSVNNWCGAGGSGVPGNSTDWACLVHDFNYDVAGLSVGSNFNFSLPEPKVQQLHKINQALCDNVSGIGGFEIAAYFSTIGSLTAPCGHPAIGH